ncbi:DUF1328 domain-containing protein [Rhodobacteraceae bacterium WD3A24]|nr:DUF1328 domain-containing protein [Rhodobacteraceae bacterium WD3A24]
MPGWATVFLFAALITGAVGFVAPWGAVAVLAQIAFFVTLLLFLGALLLRALHIRRRP